MSRKRLTEIMNLEIINVHNGEKYGYLGDCEMTFNIKTGEILNVIASESKASLFSFRDDNVIEIPWSSKLKQSEKTIIFDYKI
jgi:YlmC/YmxH family sporulation protein